MGTQVSSWVCTVCGYVHQGPEPPDVCPVCGATSDLFERHTEAPAAATATPTQWRCLNCKYVHDGAAAPEVCPVCGASAERFEPLRKSAAPAAHRAARRDIVVVGGGIAGVSAAQAVREASPGSRVRLVSKERHLPYYRLNLTRMLAGEIDAEQLPLHPRSWYDDNRIELLAGAELCRIDTKDKKLLLRGADDCRYDKLVLAMGSHPFVPPLPGANREGVTPLRTRDDAERILEQSPNARTVVIGGGVLGLETAGALAAQGCHVTLLEGHGWLLPRQLNEQAGRMLERFAGERGITLRKSAWTKELHGDERVREVELLDGERLDAQLVVIATGVRPNSHVARLAGLDVARGVIVEDHLQTSHPDIFAAGDVAEHRGVSYGTWGPSQFQGTIAGMNAAGEQSQFAGIPRSNMLKVLGYDMFSIGEIAPKDAGYVTVEHDDGGNYRYFMFRDTRMIGAILLGETSLSAAVKTTVENQTDCAPIARAGTSADEVVAFLHEHAAR